MVSSLIMNICFANNNFLPCFFLCLSAHPCFSSTCKTNNVQTSVQTKRVQRAMTNFEHVGSSNYNDLADRDNNMPLL